MPKDESIGALWECGSQKGNTYMKGVINGVKVIIFKNRYKKEHKQPDWKVFIPKEKKVKQDEEIPF